MAKVDPYGSWSINDNEEEFQNLLRIFDFPMESLEGDGLVGDWDASQLQNFGPIPPQMETVQPMIAQTKTESVFVDRKVGLNEATPELPNWFEETSCIRRHYKSTELQSQSPVSVLENGVRKGLLINSHINKRTRSKRARPSVNPWLLLSPIFPREMSKKPSQVEQAKKTFSDFAQAPSAAALQRPAAAKKCAHCEVTKTPQWREGPMGPKTLCNACGVRYRSGRLYPEYRPAASPTFVPSVHSNSHKKVVEMRTKGKQQKKVIGVEDSSIFVPVSGYL